MTKEVKHPEKKPLKERSASGVERAEQILLKNNKLIVYAFSAVLLIVASYFIYRSYVVLPNEQKASEAMWKAEDYYRRDSVRLALNGDGANAGFLRVISKYDGTKAAELARFYAAACYMRLGNFDAAIKNLKGFSVDDKLITLRATGLLGDAYSETGKKAEAVELYRKAGTMFPEDNLNSPEYLFRAGLLYQELGKNKEAIDMFRIIKDKYPTTERGVEIDKYIARLEHS